MRRIAVTAVLPLLVLLLSPGAGAQNADSLSVEQLHEAVVRATMAGQNAPFSTSEISIRTLREESSDGAGLPAIIARTPGVISWSESGTGFGTSYMRIRGSGGSRINVTLDGIPLNSPEDQTVFWANMDSYARFLGGVQIQRGIGSSTNGDGAFGGTVALASRAPSLVPTGEASFSWGSFGTRNLGLRASTGLLWKRVVLEAAWNDSATQGYIHGTAGRAGSYFGSLSWLGRNFTLSYKLFGNYEVTGQAWNGVTAGTSDLSLMDGTWGVSTGIKTYEDLYRAGLGLYNSLCERLIIDADNYSTVSYMLSDGSLWPRTTDNFWQNRHILSFSWRPSSTLSVTASAHYTGGNGWYEEFRYDNKLVKYGLPEQGEIKRADFVRKKGLDQSTFGGVASVHWQPGALDLQGGISVQDFECDHWGYLTYCSVPGVIDGDYQYYQSPASKFDGSAYVKASYFLAPGLSLFGDLQYRHVRYRSSGYNDKYIPNGDGTASRHYLDIDARYDFVNPKAGINYASGPHRAYLSLAYAGREPERNNFTDNGRYPAPKPEYMLDAELGYSVGGRNWNAGVTLYYMHYIDQLVQSGELSDIGEALTVNIARSYRTGIELTALWAPLRWLSIDGNAALSRSRLLDFDEYAEDWDNGTTVIHYNDSPLAFSPSAILNGTLTMRDGGLRIAWHTGYVSRMYLDNTGCEDRSLPAYSLSDVQVAYAFKFKKIIRELEVGASLGNVFNSRVAVSGWVYSAIYESGGHPNDNRYYQIGFIPAAPFMGIGHIRITL